MKKITFLSMTLLCYFGVYSQYCTPGVSGDLDCTDGDLISLVNFEGINNPSSCGNNAYTDYSSSVSPAQVEAGQSYMIYVTVGSGWSSETVGVWIDFNNNEIFDTDEFTLIGTGSGSIVSGSIEIPEGVASGTYRMRVSVVASNVPFDDPCFDEENYGEFEDYSVAVTNTASVGSLSFSDSIKTFKNGNDLIVNSSNSELKSIEIYDITGKLIANHDNVDSSEININLSIEKQLILVSITSLSGERTIKKVLF